MQLVLSGVLVVVGFVLATWLGTPVVKALIRQADRRGLRPDPGLRGDVGLRGEEPEIDTSKLLGLEEAAEQLRGGEWIGLLERAAVFICILVGSASGLGIILAIKGLGRYAELRTPNLAKGERFIIGTLLSWLWAGACAGLVMVGQRGVGFL